MFRIIIIVAIVFIGLFYVIAMLMRMFRKVHEATEQIRNAMGGGPQATGHRPSARQGQRQTRTRNGDTIVDTRAPQQANRKIFTKGEGEYVDYKEV